MEVSLKTDSMLVALCNVDPDKRNANQKISYKIKPRRFFHLNFEATIIPDGCLDLPAGAALP